MKLNYKQTFFIGLAFLSISAFWTLYDSIIPLILKNTFAIGDTLAGAIMAMDNVLALFLLPIFGMISDKVRTPIGKRMPFIIGGSAAAVIAMMLLPISDNTGRFPLFMISLIITLVAMSTYRSPAVALMPDVTPKPLRSKANAIINLMGAIGGVIALGLISFLVPDTTRPNYLPLFGIVAGVMVAAVVILILTIKENKLIADMHSHQTPEEKEEIAKEEADNKPIAKDVKRSLIFILLSVFLWFMAYNAVTTAFSKYAQDYLGMVGGSFANSLMIATIAAVIFFIPAGFIATKFGRKHTILGGIILMFVAFGIAAGFKSYHPVINVLLVLVGIGWASINVNSYPMVVEMAKGSDIGKYTGYYYTFSMAGQVITPVVSGAFLEFVGYGTLFPYAAVFMVFAFITMLMVKHGDHQISLPVSKIEMLDVGD